jgi:hypothetical protein
VPMPRLKLIEGAVRGLLRAYKDVYGVHALAPRRRQPMLPGMWHQIKAAPCNLRLPCGRTWDPISNHDDRTVLRLGRVLWRSGHRLGEIVGAPSGEVSYLTRSCVTFSIGKVLVNDPQAAQLRLLRAGDFVLLAPCSSKPDQFGEEHCPYPSLLPFDGSSSSAAAVMRDIELGCPCHGEARLSAPLFADALGRPYHYSTLNRRLHQLLEGLFGAAVASTLSRPSIRIGLACALHAAGCSDATIQLICRWASPESLKLYRLVGTSTHIMWCDRASAASFDAVRATSIPALDNSADYAALVSPAPSQRARAHAVVDAARPSPRVPPPPPLRLADRLEVFWTGHDAYYAGTFTSSRVTTTETGARVRLSRVLYDAVQGWPSQPLWHDLSSETWRRLP